MLNKIEGDLSGITNRQLEFIDEVISKLGFKVTNVVLEPLGVAGDNYASNVKRITVNGDQTLSLVVKIAPENEMMRKNFNTSGIFKNEHTMYTEFIPKIVALQKAANVPESEILVHAKCYGSLDEEPHEVIILEDLKPSGFAMEDRFKPLSNVCVLSILKNFSIFHSLSFVLKDKEPETFDHYKKTLFDMWSGMIEVPEMQMYFTQITNDALGVLEKEEHKDIINNKLQNVPSLAAEISKQEEENKYSIIIQGDSWTNNILFKHPTENTVESIMIDYQMSKNSSPACDLLYMLFACTDHKSRDEHLADWLDYYHTELDKSLAYYGLEAKDVYPREQLDKDLKRYGKLMLGIAFMLCNLLIRKTEDAAVVKEAMENMKEFDEAAMAEMAENMKISALDDDTVALYKSKITGILDTCVQFDLV